MSDDACCKEQSVFAECRYFWTFLHIFCYDNSRRNVALDLTMTHQLVQRLFRQISTVHNKKKIEKKIKYFTSYTRRNIFEILWNQTEIILYLPFSDWFGATNGHCPFAVPNQSVHIKYIFISVWFNKISKRFLCVRHHPWSKKLFAFIKDRTPSYLRLSRIDCQVETVIFLGLLPTAGKTLTISRTSDREYGVSRQSRVPNWEHLPGNLSVITVLW